MEVGEDESDAAGTNGKRCAKCKARMQCPIHRALNHFAAFLPLPTTILVRTRNVELLWHIPSDTVRSIYTTVLSCFLPSLVERKSTGRRSTEEWCTSHYSPQNPYMVVHAVHCRDDPSWPCVLAQVALTPRNQTSPTVHLQ